MSPVTIQFAPASLNEVLAPVADPRPWSRLYTIVLASMGSPWPLTYVGLPIARSTPVPWSKVTSVSASTPMPSCETRARPPSGARNTMTRSWARYAAESP